MTPQRKLVSIIAPFYNEETGVELFYSAIAAAIEPIQHVDFEVICVDDGSRDGTLPMLISLSQRDQRFKVIEMPRSPLMRIFKIHRS